MSAPFMWDGPLITYFKSIMDKLGLDTVFETGTYRGDTAHWLYRQGYKVITVEINKPQYEQNMTKFKDTTIKAINAPSESVLPTYIMEYDTTKTLFYLDAHAHGYEKAGRYGPLADELKYLFTLPKFIALIHDVNWDVKGTKYRIDLNHYSIELQGDFDRIKLPRDVDITVPTYDGYGCAYLFISRGYDLVDDPNFYHDRVTDIG